MADMTEGEAESIIRQFSQGNQNVHSFMTNIVQSDDTTKTGNLTQDELGMPKVPVRTIKELELFSQDIAQSDDWSSYFKKLSEVQTATSLSKEGLLVKLAVTIKKELADVTKKVKENGGWFKRQNPQGEVQ